MDDVAEIAEETSAFLAEVADNQLAPLWEIYHNLINHEPSRAEPAVIWKWRELEPMVARSAELVKGEEAEHRVLILNNPHLDGPPATTSTIVAGYQCVLPGEKTSPHRHTPAATRVILEGTGGATFVDGKRCDMYDGDLIITPNWTWHCHENDSEKRTIWLDVLDLPLVGKLDAVNSILLGIGEAPVNTLGSGLQEAEIAEVTLNNINREVQTIGWHFNTEVRYSLGKNSDGIINLPSNCLKVDVTSVLRDYEA